MTKNKQIDFFEIKKALQDQPSANLELIIQDCAYLIRRKAVEEYLKMVEMASKISPEDLDKLKS